MSQANNATPDAPFRLYLLGAPNLVDNEGQSIAGMGPGKPLAMLSYLVLSGSAQREELVALLWPEMPEDRARNAFRQTLHRVRGALGSDVLKTDRETIALASGERLWCDVLEFQRAVSTNARRAAALYAGPFLGGLNVGAAPFEQWAEGQRERLEAQYRSALDTAINDALENGDKEQALELAKLLSRVAPLDAQAAVLEAKVLVAAGRKPEAISVLTQHTARIQSELGTKPAVSVGTLLQHLMKDAPAPAGARSSSADLLPEAEFTGRDRELGQLLALWRGIEDRGALGIVTGPAGIGKTRLLREFVQRASALGSSLVLWGQERHGNRTIPYAALADALRPAVHAPGLAGASQSLLAEAARLLPEIRDQFNLPEPAAIDDDAARIRFFDGVASLIDAVAFEQPLCIVVEDLHHASTSSVELLRFLTQRLSKAPVLFLVSFRPLESPPYVLERFDHPDTQGQSPQGSAADGAFAHLPLQGLETASVERMMESVTVPSDLDTGTRQAIVASSEGNPFRALDLIRRARRGEPIAKLPIELSAALWARLPSCSPQEQRLFLASALLGRPASLRLLAAATHLSEPDAFDAALALEQRGLVVQQLGGVAPAHDTLAAIVLERTGSAGRALLAGWTADALASEPAASNAELAQLYAEAGQPSSAHRYARAAILDAAAAGAAEELDNAIALAAQTALNPGDRRAVESLRTALRGDGRRLGRGDTRIEPDLPADRVRSASEGSEERPGPRAAPQPNVSASWLTKHRRTVQLAAAGFVAVLGSAAIVQDRRADAGARGTVLSDSAVVEERTGPRTTRRYLVTGSIFPVATLHEARGASEPDWIADLSLPWINPRVAPDGRFVALEQITPAGANVYVISSNQQDTVPIATGAGDDLIGGWSPDGKWLLVIRESAEGDRYRSNLYAYLVGDPRTAISLDTNATHFVVDAVWSPTGTHVAWTARTGRARQQDLFVSATDGGRMQNLTASESEDYHPAWSPDGSRLAFTSDRAGNAEIYSIEVLTSHLRRLTFNDGPDDRAVFSPAGSFIAYESTRQGRVGVYAMPPLGGSARRLTPEGRNFELAGWRGRAPSYVSELHALVPATLAPGATTALAASAVDQYGTTMLPPELEWKSLDTTVEVSAASGPATSATRTLVARAVGLGRVVATVGAWRADTAYALVGARTGLLQESFANGIVASRWISLGDPLPFVSRTAGVSSSEGLVLRSDRQWESGILGTNIIPLRPGVSVSARVRAPFSGGSNPGGFTIALVAAEAGDAIDQSAPQFLKLVALSWLSEAGRLAYSAEREFWSESVRFGRGEDWHSFRIEIEPDGRVAFYVEGRLRKRSSVVVTGKPEEALVQLWIAGRGTAESVIVDDVVVRISDR